MYSDSDMYALVDILDKGCYNWYQYSEDDMLLDKSELDRNLIEKALWPSAEAARNGIMSIWELADISKEDITFLTCGDDPYDDDVVLNKLFHPHIELLIVTEGSEGCRHYTKDFKGRVAGFKAKPVDTTGASDAFVSGFLYSLASDPSILKDKENLRKALYFANVCGGITVMERGAIPALLTKDAVLQFDAK
ncbi:fructokinase-5-like protein [Trifolium pratense]|uniref:Fructokinase-5-like protein n=1 Tax=Trifolium pratense TaxID=57577 RepID=A0A2K3PC88_TRIPR|nr:fructokinase-5-like protein [Trifolium pratense]